jgi:hypothetical protein
MSPGESEFLNAIVLRTKPQKHFTKWYPPEAVEFLRRVNEFQNRNFARRNRFTQPTLVATEASEKNSIYWQYCKYKILAKLTFGKKRKYYKVKRDLLREKVR